MRNTHPLVLSEGTVVRGPVRHLLRSDAVFLVFYKLAGVHDPSGFLEDAKAMPADREWSHEEAIVKMTRQQDTVHGPHPSLQCTFIHRVVIVLHSAFTSPRARQDVTRISRETNLALE